MDKIELKEILEKHKAWLEHKVYGEMALLENIDLREINLSHANLRNIWLRKSDLRKANLRKIDLRKSELQGTDLREADLAFADLTGANLKDCDLRGADIDFSCWPLCRGSLGVTVDKRIACQLAYHFCSLKCDDEEYIAARNMILNFANQFHRVEEYGQLEEING